MTWDELVADVTARYPLKESKMFGMPCLKRENGKVVAGHWRDGGLTVKLTDPTQREAALAAGAEPFDPAAKPPVRDSGPVEGVRGNRDVSPRSSAPRVMKEWVLVPASHSDDWLRLVEQAI